MATSREEIEKSKILPIQKLREQTAYEQELYIATLTERQKRILARRVSDSSNLLARRLWQNAILVDLLLSQTNEALRHLKPEKRVRRKW